MTGPLYYPKADYQTQYYGPGSVVMPMNRVKWVEHTTESYAWPSYNGGGDAPTLTYHPGYHKWRGHFKTNESARALRNDVYPTVNRVDVVQTEIVCFSDQHLAEQYKAQGAIYVEDLDDQAINDLGDFAAWLSTEWGMHLNWFPDAINWPAYNGQQPFQRMSWDTFVNFSGVLGHIGVPGQVHLDPANLDNISIKKVAEAVSGQSGGYDGPFPVLRKAESDAGWSHNHTYNYVIKPLEEFVQNHPNMADVKAALDAAKQAAPLLTRAHNLLQGITHDPK